MTPAPGKIREGWVYAFLAYITVLLLYPVLVHQASFCIKQDNLHQAYPFMNKLASSLHRGYLPTWDANTFSGNTFAGGFETGIFYPPSLLFCWIFGSARGINVYYLDLLVVVHYLLALLGMYQLARVFRITVPGAVAAALVYSFSGILSSKSGGQTCIFFGLALLPWCIYFIASYYWSFKKRRCLVGAGLIAGLEILAGHIQPFFHTMLIAGVVVAFYEFRERKSWAGYFRRLVAGGLLILGPAMLIALPQLYYSAEYLVRCYRWVSGGVFVGPGQKVPLFLYSHWFILRLYNLANFLGKNIFPPDDDNRLYLGILPLLLVIAFLSTFRHLKIGDEHRRLTTFLLGILVFGVFAALGFQTFLCYVLYEIPFVNTVRQLGRYAILIHFSAALMTGLGIGYLKELKDYFFSTTLDRKFYVVLILFINSLYWVLFQANAIEPGISLPFLLAFLFILLLIRSPRPGYIPFLAIAIICIDLYCNKVDYLPATPPNYSPNIYARDRIIDTLEKTYGKYRVAFNMENREREKRNLGDMYDIQTTYGYSATYFDKYFMFMPVGKKNDPSILDLLNVRYVLTDKILDSNFIFRDSVYQTRLYERKSYYPRCYWKRQLGRSGPMIEAENKATIQLLNYTDLYQKWTVDCVQADTLIFSEVNYPGWICYDNGRKVPIYSPTIQHYPSLFKGIALDKGRHIIEFSYRKSFYWF